MKISNDVWFIFLGSFLTFLATIIVESYKNIRENRAKSKNFKLVVKQELLSINKLLEKLKTVFEFRRYYDYSILNEIRKGVTHLESESPHAIYLSNESLQEKFLDLTSDLSAFETEIKSTQDVYYQQNDLIKKDEEDLKINKKTKRKSAFMNYKENLEAYDQKSVQKSIDLVEINRRLDEFVKLITK